MSNIHDFVITKAGKLKKYKGGDKNVIVPDGVVEITAVAFSDISGGPEVILLPDTIKKISFNAFLGCRNLVCINIPDGITHIGSGAFNDCNSLKSITIPANIKKIEGPLSNSKSIWEIIVPDDMVIREKCWQAFLPDHKIVYCFTNIRRGIALSPTETAFFKRSFSTATELAILHQDVEALAAVFATKKKVKLDVIDPLLEQCADMPDICAFLMDYKNKNYSTESIIQHSIEKQEKELDPAKRSISDWRKIFKFAASPKDGKVSIDGYKGNQNAVVIPEKIKEYTVTSISKQAFMRMRGITEVTINEGIAEIGAWAFERCSNLEKITLPESLSEIDWGAFAGCISLNEVTIPGNVKEISHGAFEKCLALKKATICEGVTSIEVRAFYLCEELQVICIPASVSSIALAAFTGCEKLCIHAPAGSYAETYAKENNIPFVTE